MTHGRGRNKEWLDPSAPIREGSQRHDEGQNQLERLKAKVTTTTVAETDLPSARTIRRSTRASHVTKISPILPPGHKTVEGRLAWGKA